MLDPIRDNLKAQLAASIREASLGPSGPRAWHAYLRCSELHHLLGIAHLLADADVKAFRSELAESGRVRLAFLTTAGRAPEAIRQARSGHLFPVFDSLVAGQDELARDIARASRDGWAEGEEYEDDFRWAMIVHSLVRSGGRFGAVDRGLITRYEKALGTAFSARLSVAEAFADGDATRLAEAIGLLAGEWREEREVIDASTLVPGEKTLLEKHVFIEGLGLVAIAAMAGLAVEPPLPFMPDVAWPRA